MVNDQLLTDEFYVDTYQGRFKVVLDHFNLIKHKSCEDIGFPEVNVYMFEFKTGGAYITLSTSQLEGQEGINFYSLTPLYPPSKNVIDWVRGKLMSTGMLATHNDFQASKSQIGFL